MSAATLLRELTTAMGRLEARALVDDTCLAITATDFLTGGRADFARALSPRGSVLEIIRRAPNEPYDAFLARVAASGRAVDAHHIVIGGIPNSPTSPLRPSLSRLPTARYPCPMARCMPASVKRSA
jgi:hypothetical protein